MKSSVRIVISGLPGSGKTFSILKIIELLEGDGFSIGGMVTLPILEEGRRVGYYIENWATKEKEIFAHISYTNSKIKYGKFGVMLSVLEGIGVASLEYALQNNDLVVIDEVGTVQVESDIFADEVRNVIKSDKPFVITIHKKSRHPLLQEIRRKDDVRILEVTAVNVKILPFKVLNIFHTDESYKNDSNKIQ